MSQRVECRGGGGGGGDARRQVDVVSVVGVLAAILVASAAGGAPTTPSDVITASSGPSCDQPAILPYRQRITNGNDKLAPWVADIDGDGRNDVVFANASLGMNVGLLVYWNGAEGIGPVPTSLGVPGRTLFTAVGDFDGDGMMDVVGLSRDERIARAHRQFVPRIFLPDDAFEIAATARRLLVGDVDVDGTDDLIVVGSETVSVARGSGDGLVVTVDGFGLPFVGGGATLMDVDRDGAPDLVAVSATLESGGYAVAMNDGSGAWGPFTIFDEAVQGIDLLVMDTDEDGIEELVVPSAEATAFHELELAADGRLVRRRDVPVAVGPLTARRGVGRDGASVVHATSDRGPGSGPILTLVAHPGIGLVPETLFSGNDDAVGQIAVGDLDGSGIDDIVVADFQQAILFDRPDGGHGPSTPIALGADRHVVLDVDRDGDLDVVAQVDRSIDGTGALRVFLNDGRGRFESGRELDPDAGPPVLVELDGHAPGEIAAIVDGHWTTWAFEEGGTPVVTTIGDAARAESLSLPVRAGDFDGDGRSDLVVAGGGIVRILTFVPGVGYLESGSWRTLDVAGDGSRVGVLETVIDADGDGVDDLLLEGYDGRVSVLAGVPGGGFRVAPLDPPLEHVLDLAVADVDGDGRRDLLAVVQAPLRPRFMVLRRGLERGGFAAATETVDPPPWALDAVVIADFDGDGFPDLIGPTEPNPPWRRFFLGDGTGRFTKVPTVRVELGGRFTVADMDSDGDPDIVADMGGRLLSVLRTGCDVYVPGDVDGDGVVGLDDLLAVLARFGPCACPADLDRDGLVDAYDLALVLAGWSG